MKRGALALLLALGACNGGSTTQANVAEPQDLESAAIERGLVRDPGDREIVGLYARDTDRVCIVAAGDGYRMGAYVDYGDGITCSGAGKVTRVGETLHVELGPDDSCSFKARFDGDRVIFPGNVPDGCAKLCARRASYAGLEAARLSDSTAEAAAMRDSNGRPLCGN